MSYTISMTIASVRKNINCESNMYRLGHFVYRQQVECIRDINEYWKFINKSGRPIVKYKPLLFFQKLCDSCTSTHALFLFLQTNLFPQFSPNPNVCMLEKSKSTRTLIHESQRFPKNSGQLILNDLQ